MPTTAWRSGELALIRGVTAALGLDADATRGLAGEWAGLSPVAATVRTGHLSV